MRREIQNPQMFDTDPAQSPFPQQTTLVTTLEESYLFDD
jgi:hypothetical protein